MAVIDALSTPAAREINTKIYEIKKEYSKRRQLRRRGAESIYIMKRGGGEEQTHGKRRGATARRYGDVCQIQGGRLEERQKEKMMEG